MSVPVSTDRQPGPRPHAARCRPNAAGAPGWGSPHLGLLASGDGGSLGFLREAGLSAPAFLYILSLESRVGLGSVLSPRNPSTTRTARPSGERSLPLPGNPPTGWLGWVRGRGLRSTPGNHLGQLPCCAQGPHGDGQAWSPVFTSPKTETSFTRGSLAGWRSAPTPQNRRMHSLSQEVYLCG